MFLSFEYSKRFFLFYNGYTESPFSHVPKSNVDQSMSPNELRHHYSKKKGHNRWPDEEHFPRVNNSWQWTYRSHESIMPLKVDILWHTMAMMLVKKPWLHWKIVSLWWTTVIWHIFVQYWSEVSKNRWIVITKEKCLLMHFKSYECSTSSPLDCFLT